MISKRDLQRYIKSDEDQQANLQGLAELRGLPYEFLYAKGILAVPDLSIINHFEYVTKTSDEDLGITDSNIDQFNEGFLIPVWDGYGNLIMWVNWNGDRSSKYINIKLRDKEDKVLYEKVKLFGMESLEHGLADDVMFATEGVFDALTLQYLHLPATALLGSSTMDYSKTFYERFQQVYYVRDMDAIGYSAWVKFSKRVPNAKLLELPNLMDKDGKQIKDMNDFIRYGQTTEYAKGAWHDYVKTLQELAHPYDTSRFH